MKKILCFGDSNTYGFNPEDGSRYSKETRWTGILQELLGNDFKIIEAGLNNRNCFTKSPHGKSFCGKEILPDYLKDEFYSVIFALGINDLQISHDKNLEIFKEELIQTISMIKKGVVLLICPATLREDILKSAFSFLFDKASIDKSKMLPKIYKEAANKTGAIFVNLNDFVTVSKFDGLHFDKESHKKIANILYETLLEIK